MEKKKYPIDPEILSQLEGHPHAKEILEILSEDPDKDFYLEKSKNEIILEELNKLLKQLRFEETNEDNCYECKVYYGSEYVGYVRYKIEGSKVEIIDFGTANKKNISSDISDILRYQLSNMSYIEIKYLGFSILYYLFEEFAKKGIYSFEIVSSKGSIKFYKKFFRFMEEVGKVELADWGGDNVFNGYIKG